MFKFHHYRFSCTERGLKYFPCGIREGVLVELDHCYGEWAPILGFHEHSVSDLIDQLNLIDPKKIIGLSGSADELADYLKLFSYPASYVLSMIIYHRSIIRKMDKTPKIKAAILVLDDAKACIDEAYQCLKIKVGNQNLRQDIALIRSIAMYANNKIKLRLDANRSYSYQEALSLWRAIIDLDLEYIEEPSYELDKLALLAEQGMPIALDESFQDGASQELLFKSKAKYLVVKPSRFSSIHRIMLLAKLYKKLGIQVIFSTCFESDFSHMIHAYLIDELGCGENFHGTFDQKLFITSHVDLLHK